MKEIKSFDVFSLGKLQAFMMVFVIAVVSIVFIIVGLFTLIFSFLGGLAIIGIGLAILVFGGLLYGLVGFIFGLIFGGIYNWLAKKFGGIKLELN